MMKFLEDRDSQLCTLYKALCSQKDLRKILNGSSKAALLPTYHPEQMWSSCWHSPLFLFSVRNLYKILDSCKQLTVSQGSGEDDTTGMVTIITGFQLEDLSLFSVPMQVSSSCLAALSHSAS